MTELERDLTRQLEDTYAQIKLLEARLGIRDQLISELQSTLDKQRPIPNKPIRKSESKRVSQVDSKEHDDKDSY